MKKITVAVAALMFLVCVRNAAAATGAAITAATGGSSISADTAGGTYSTASFTALTGPVINENNPGGISTGTIVLNAPTGFMFDTSSAVTIAITRTASSGSTGLDISLSSTNAVVTASTITITIAAQSTGSRANTLTYRGIKVRPTSGAPLASGTITKSGTASYTETGSIGNYGSLAEVAGTTRLMITTLPGETFTSGSGNTGTVTSQTAGTSFALTRLTATDQFTNLTTSYTGSKTISYSGPSGTPTYTTTVSFSSGVSTTTLTTTLLRAETTSITATDGSLVGVASSLLTVNAGPIRRLQILLPGESTSPGTTSGKTGSPTSIAASTTISATVNYTDGNWNPISSSDTVHFTSTDSFAVLPADGTLTNGSGVFSITLKTRTNTTITVSDLSNGSVTNGTSSAITVTNNAPTLTTINTLTGALEDTTFTISYATLRAQSDIADIDVNASDTLSFRIEAINSGTLTQSGTNVVAGSTLLTPTGASIVWRAATNVNGTINAFTVKAFDGSLYSASAVQVAAVVTAVNDAPSFTKGANQTVLEDSTAATVSGWATSISSGPANESSQVVSFVVSNDNTNLFAVQPAVSSSGTLSFTPAANANGSATVTIYAQDNGGTANSGADSSASQTFTITVTAVNDVPSFTKGANVTVLEDSGAQTIASWATSISAGPTNESSQTLTFTTSNNNTTLFSSQPAISSTGQLTFTPAANSNGTATVTVTLKDNGGTANGGSDTTTAQTFTITVTAVNDAPSFTKGANQTVLEDAAAQTVSGWATSINTGANNETSQTVSFVLTNNNPGLFSIQPAVSSTGTLTYTPAANANGTATVTVYAQDNGGTSNGGSDSSATQTFSINVTAVNDTPGFTKGANVTVFQDAGAQSISGWATAISPGPTDESAQALTFTTSNNNNSLFSVQPAISSSGTLTFTSAAGAIGTATVTVTLADNGGTANGGSDTSAAQTFVITVNDVNDAPSFIKGANQTVLEDSGVHTVSNWATSISAGPSETQVVTFVVSNDNPSLFSSQPAVTSAGTLTYTPASNANGTATVTIYATDDGGTANGGSDTSASQTFSITITPVNDVPSFAKGTNVVVRTTTTTQSLANWATSINTGAANESQNLTFHVSNDNNAMFSVQPSVSATGTLTFTPTANGTATVTIDVQDDGGTSNGGLDTSASQTFTITVYPINLAPTFSMATNLTVLEDCGAQTNVTWATNISAGAADEAGQTLTFVVTNSNNSLFSVQPTLTADGTLTFTPAADSYGSAVVTVVLQDDGDSSYNGTNQSVAQSFVLDVTAVNDAPGFTKGLDIALGIASSRSQTIGAWATDVTAGANESSQNLTFVVTNDTPDLFSQQPAISSNGTLSFEISSTATNVLATVSVQLTDDGGTSNGGINASTVQTFRIALSSTYGATTNIATGNGPTGLYLGNLRGLTFAGATKSGGPRYRDMIIANYLDNTISIRFCNDDGTFTDPITYPVGLNPFGVFSADLNKDGYEEILCANSGTNTISVLANNIDRTFSSAVDYVIGSTPNPNPMSVISGDFNGDGRLDVVVANYNENNVSVLLNIGGGNLGTATNFAVGQGPMSVWVGDFNKDKKTDILTADKDSGTLTILPGLGNGSFGTAQTITLFPGGDPQPVYAVPSDLNGDGRLDIVTANYNSNSVSVLLGQSNGSYVISSNYAVGTHPRSVLVRDLDHDGKLDIASANNGSASVSVLHNRGDGTYTYAGNFAVGGNPVIVWGSNFDSDGATDLAISNYGDNTISIFRYNGPLAYDGRFSLLEDQSKAITLTGSILNNSGLTYTILEAPAHGSLSGTPPNLTYTPASNYNGTDSFKYQVLYTTSGLILDSSAATISLVISPVNDAPTFTLSTGLLDVTNFNILQTISGFATGISAGASDETNQQLSFVIKTTNSALFDVQPKISSGGTLTFRPGLNKSGTAYLSVRLTDNGGALYGGTNGTATQTFVINIASNPFAPVKGIYNGLFYETNGISKDSAGFVNVNLTDKRTFTGKLLLTGKTYTLSGAFGTNGTAQLTVPRTNQTSLTVDLLLPLSAPDDQIHGTVTDGTWISTLLGDRSVFSTLANPAPQAGKYTLVIGGNPGNSAKPAGDGIGLATVSAAGTVSFSGTLADGTAVAQAVSISKNGQWPLYASVYGGNGVVIGWVTFTNTVETSLEGDLSWIKTGAVGGKYYPLGFTNDIVTVGSSYVAPATGLRLLSVTNAFVEVSDGNLSVPMTNSVTLATNNVFTVTPANSNSLSLTASATYGTISGGFVNPRTKVKSAVKGVVLQKQNKAYGFFLGTNQSGLFQLHE